MGTSGAEREVIETYHDRVRETLVAHLTPEARVDCHERLALALLASGETDPETLAIHFQGANQPERAAAYFARGADQAAETLAFDRAAKLYRLVLEMQPGPGPGQDQEDRRQLRTKLGDALAGAGAVPRRRGNTSPRGRGRPLPKHSSSSVAPPCNS